MTTRLRLGLVVLVLLAAVPAVAQEALQPGMGAPRVVLETLDGRQVATTGHGGARAVLIVFWATWSNKSPEALERVAQLATKLGPEGLVVLAVNVEAPVPDAAALDRVRATSDRLRLAGTVALDRNLQAFHAFGVVAVPTMVLTSGDGTVLATLASYPIAGREEFFELAETTVTGRGRPAAPARGGVAPAPRAVRYFHLGRTMASRGQVEQAMQTLRLAIDADPAFPLPRVLLGQLARERAVAQHSVRWNGEGVETFRLVETERDRLLADAETALAEAVRLAPTSAPALTELALVHRHRSRAARARELLERAIAADAGYSPAHAALGVLLLESGDVDRGRRALDTAIELNPLDGRLHIAAAEALEARGLSREAAAAYRRGVELLWQARQRSAP